MVLERMWRALFRGQRRVVLGLQSESWQGQALCREEDPVLWSFPPPPTGGHGIPLCGFSFQDQLLQISCCLHVASPCVPNLPLPPPYKNAPGFIWGPSGQLRIMFPSQNPQPHLQRLCQARWDSPVPGIGMWLYFQGLFSAHHKLLSTSLI